MVSAMWFCWFALLNRHPNRFILANGRNPVPLFQKRVFMQTLSIFSNENELNLHQNESVGGTRPYEQFFKTRFDTAREKKGTRNWPMVNAFLSCFL